MDLFIDPVSYRFDEEKYEDENVNPGLKEIYKSFSKFNSKIKIQEVNFSEFKESLKYLDSDDDYYYSESDSD